MTYELCYLVGESKDQDLPKIKEEVKNIVLKEGGQWLPLVVEEKRKLAYKVEKNSRGTYITQRFELNESEADENNAQEKKNAVSEISKKINLYQDVARFIIIKASELPELKVMEIRETVRKNSKKPMYVKKESALSKVAARKEAIISKEPSIEEKTEEKLISDESAKTKGKNIDEKIDEILNI